MTLIIMVGEIDLSVASTLAISAETLGYLWAHGWPMGAILVVVIAIGAVAGAINGFLVTRVGLPSLAVTIGTLSLYRGLANVVLGPLTVSNYPAFFTNLGVESFPGVPFLSWSVVIFLVLAVVTGVVLHMTPFGRSLYAIGLGREAAVHAGIRVQRIKMLLFVLSGVICALVGMLYTFELSSARRGHRDRVRAEGDHDRARRRRLHLRRRRHDPRRRAGGVRLREPAQRAAVEQLVQRQRLPGRLGRPA